MSPTEPRSLDDPVPDPPVVPISASEARPLAEPNEPCSFMLTEREVAEYFSVSIHTVRQWRYTGLLPFVKVGHHVRIESEELLKFVARHRHRKIHKEEAIPA